MEIEKKVNLLRKVMKDNGVDFYLAPSTDQHNDEYVPECWQRRNWITGFDGSAGEALIGIDCGFLWTDGRYFIQAEQQLNPKIFELKKQKSFSSELELWMKDNINGKVLAVDPKLISINRANTLVQIAKSYNGTVKFIEENLIDIVKKNINEFSNMPFSEVCLYDIKYSGCSTQDKISNLQSELKKQNIQSIILTSLDEIAWLYNIRGNDISFNPLTISYAIIDQKDAYWFVNTKKISSTISLTLAKQGVSICEYQAFANAVKELTISVWLDANVINFWIKSLLDKSVKTHLAESPIILAKACKNNVEIDGTKKAHKMDAIAVIKFLHWIKHNWSEGIDELNVIPKLKKFRKESLEYKGDSFDTISSFGPNGAIVHYHCSKDTSKVIDDSSLYLLDSGGQYNEGTTDITRTIHLGKPTDEQQKNYTLVLKGHIQLAQAVFPYGVTGEQIDILARLAIWKDYKNYRHGTGHGVGCFLCVHEGPQKISQAHSEVPLLPGMILSNEPGLYFENKYGIRIENLMFIKQLCNIDSSETEDGPFYGFEDFTLVPYAQNLIDKSLLNSEEINWINQYHKKVWDNISHHITDSSLLNWLKEETKAI